MAQFAPEREGLTWLETSDRTLLYALLTACIPLLIMLGMGIFLPTPAGIDPTPHPNFDSMLSSGSAAPGGPPMIVAGWATGLLIIVMIGICLLIGVAPTAKWLRRWIVGGTVAYALVFCALMLSYLEFLEGGPLEIFGGLPAPTAWMMYGVWLFPWVYIIALVVTFDHSYFPPESEARLRELLNTKERR